MLVVDASVFAPVVADAGVDGQRFRERLGFPITVYPTAPLLRRVWDLRPDVTSYDGCYLALAEAVGAPLLTADRRLADAPGNRCSVEVL